jgi:ABC-type Mn2+/Zn2+ transport system ATPase subunit
MSGRSSTGSPLGRLQPPAPAVARPPEAKPVLAVEQADLGYGRQAVLRDVNVQIHQGEFWCLLGPNGEGKSTFIKALLGALRPLRGKIFLRPDFANRTRLGFVPQECELNPTVPTTVTEFVCCGFVGLSLAAHVRASRLKQILEMLGLTRLREQSFWTLSGGQRQRCLIARALVRDPLLLIVDEPTAGLDLAAATGLLEVITDLSRNKGITVVFVTHDLQIAAQRASHIAFFKSGQVTAGPLGAVFTEENLSRTFGVPIEVRRDAAGWTAIAQTERGLSSPQQRPPVQPPWNTSELAADRNVRAPGAAASLVLND